MTVGRNDPCPCGSGKKYKHCCLPRDAESGRTERRLHLSAASPQRARGNAHGTAHAPPTAAPDAPWEIDLVPLLAQLGDDPAARLVAVLVVADGFVLHADVLSQPSAEPGELAQMLETAVTKTIASVGWPPRDVRVRYESLARDLAPLVEGRGIRVVVDRELSGASAAGRSVRSHMAGQEVNGPLGSAPETWAGWGLPAEQIGRLFAASAAYHRAAPWRTIADDMPLTATMPGGSTWMLVILGNAGEVFGLAMYADAEDLEALYAAMGPAEAHAHLRGAVLSVTFGRNRDMSPAARREIRREGWEVAGAAAYPLLLVLGTPGGGVTAGQMDDLIAALAAMPPFMSERERAAARGIDLLEWTDPSTGVALRASAAVESLWAVPGTLALAGPEGPGARPGARLAPDDDERSILAMKDDLLERFANFLERGGRGRARSPRTVAKHLSGANLFLEFLFMYQNIPPHAVTEFDLREFLYRWYPQKVMDTAAAAKAMPAALQSFFAFLEHEEGVRCPWAAAPLGDRESFMHRWSTRPRGSFIIDDDMQEWVAALTADLDARVLLPLSDPEIGIPWGGFAGVVEAELWDDLQRRWLVWRDELIRAGVTGDEALMERLIERQRAWSVAPNAVADGATPARAIAREQQTMARR